ncbi:MAG: hypothetical protein NTV19_03600 [Burkholderiales bacterium]|nr:hypothetical protein [Burkholderiales bacterium]
MNKPIGDRRAGRVLMHVLWPAFLMSAVAEGVFFSMIDPQELTVVGLHLADSREAAYTVGFFIFWVLFSICSALTYLLSGAGGARRSTMRLSDGPPCSTSCCKTST